MQLPTEMERRIALLDITTVTSQKWIRKSMPPTWQKQIPTPGQRFPAHYDQKRYPIRVGNVQIARLTAAQRYSRTAITVTWIFARVTMVVAILQRGHEQLTYARQLD